MRLRLRRRPRTKPASQERFAFLESRLRFERRAKGAIVAATAAAIAGLMGGTAGGRYLVATGAAAARSGVLRAIGGDPGRGPVEASWRARREFGVEATRGVVRRVYAEARPEVAELLRYAGMTPDEALIRWGNFDWTLLLSPRVFAADDAGRSYRLRPNVHSVWLRVGLLPQGLHGFFLVPDGPALDDLRKRTGVAVVPGTGQTTNSWGCRGPEPDTAAAVRVLVLGDSVMQGLMVGDDETPPFYLERDLRDRLGTTVSVLNTGHLGYSPEQYFFTLREYAGRFRPTVVVVSLCVNDFPEQGWDESLYWLDRIEQDCRSARRSCVLVPAPLDLQVAGRRSVGNIQSRLALSVATPSAEFLDPMEEFVDEQLRQSVAHGSSAHSPLYNGHLDDHHFSPLGARVWARAVSRRLALLWERARARAGAGRTR